MQAMQRDGGEGALVENSIIMVEGRLSIRETKIVANKIYPFGEQKHKKLVLNITNATDEDKEKLRGAIKYFSGEKNNATIYVQIGEELKPCGGIYLTDEIEKFLTSILN